ncbi:uncharacterized protein VP01_3028g3 [Puccinia sorghi]|uniref:HAT C-terminal dimerisation domain-containing protein n=1 Tax=Puccinia sorghi TaxID=27349 RepID=A0A0L6V1X3_9BASI|nr:uncharacterized protein VP01_3028g3 [Puccinia sorghi]
MRILDACKTYCGSSGQPRQYSLSDAEWDKVAQISKFLAPLNDVTKILCQSNFPTLTMTPPIYMSPIKTIYQIHAEYNAARLIPAADNMIINFKKYLVLVLKKPVPICSMILDLQIKLKQLKKNPAFLAEHNITTLTAFNCSPSEMQKSGGTSKNDLSKRSPCLSELEANIFGEYLLEVNEKATTSVRAYWSQHRKIYPSFAHRSVSSLDPKQLLAPSDTDLHLI